MENWQFFTLILTNIIINGTVALIAYRIGVYHKMKMDSMEAELKEAIATITTKIEDPDTFKQLGEGIVTAVSGNVLSKMQGMWGATKASVMAFGEEAAPTKGLALLDIALSGRGKKAAIKRNAVTLFGDKLGPKIEKDPVATLQEYANKLMNQNIPEPEALKKIDEKAKELGLNVKAEPENKT